LASTEWRLAAFAARKLVDKALLLDLDILLPELFLLQAVAPSRT